MPHAIAFQNANSHVFPTFSSISRKRAHEPGWNTVKRLTCAPPVPCGRVRRFSFISGKVLQKLVTGDSSWGIPKDFPGTPTSGGFRYFSRDHARFPCKMNENVGKNEWIRISIIHMTWNTLQKPRGNRKNTPRPVGGKTIAPWEPLQNLVKTNRNSCTQGNAF